MLGDEPADPDRNRAACASLVVRRCVAVAATVLLLTWTSRAETRNLSTLEWLACASDVILVGRVTAVSEVRGEGQQIFDVCSVRVAEVLKGSVEGDVFRFAILRYSDDSPLKGVARSGHDAVFFLSASEETARLTRRAAAYVPTSMTGPVSIIDLEELPSDLYSKEGRAIVDPTEVVAIARRWATSPITRSIAREPAVGLDLATSTYLLVPAEESYRSRFLEMARSKDPNERRTAALELGKFPGPESESALGELVADVSESRSFYSADELVKITYTVRAAALESLRALGKPVPDVPVEREPTVEERRAVRHGYWRESFDAALGGGWSVVSVEDAEARNVDDRETVSVVVTCGRGREHCAFVLIPEEWEPDVATTGEPLGIDGHFTQGARRFYLRGELPADVLSAVVSYFGLEPERP